MAADDRVVAVGESGLDFYRDHATPAAQHAAFGDHIDLAKACPDCGTKDAWTDGFETGYRAALRSIRPGLAGC